MTWMILLDEATCPEVYTQLKTQVQEQRERVRGIAWELDQLDQATMVVTQFLKSLPQEWHATVHCWGGEEKTSKSIYINLRGSPAKAPGKGDRTLGNGEGGPT